MKTKGHRFEVPIFNPTFTPNEMKMENEDSPRPKGGNFLPEPQLKWFGILLDVIP
jgi:hypothetical protein